MDVYSADSLSLSLSLSRLCKRIKVDCRAEERRVETKKSEASSSLPLARVLTGSR